MADMSQLTSVFYRYSNPDSTKVPKRCRQPLSCLSCRSRKLKCDREQPCGACVKRGEQDSCQFSPGAPSAAPGRSHEAQIRLRRLEQMVQELVNATGPVTKAPQGLAVQGKTQSQATSSDSSEPVAHDASTPGSAASSTALSDTTYYGATHWAAFLDHIREIQVALDAEPDVNTAPASPPIQQPPYHPSPDLLFGNTASLTIEGVMHSLPSRQNTDKLVSLYFTSKFTTVPFIHVHQFQRQYEAFWRDPQSTSFMWISILFSILCVASIIARMKGYEESLHLELRDPSFLMGKAVESLVAGEYITNKKYAIEALLIHAHSRNICSKNSDSVLWAILGFTMRLAQRSGYHRDPTQLRQHFSPFEAEMRRRTWYYLEGLELLFSCQLGMSPTVQDGGSDTKVPSNYSDDEFDEDTVVMPPPRPHIDPTPILYLHTKSKLCQILRKLMAHVLSLQRPEFRTTCALNDELHLWYGELPASLRIRPIRETSFNDQNYTVMYRIVLELVYRRAICVLHRPYIGLGNENGQYRLSKDICRDSALKVLHLHAEFDRETQPGGRMYEDRFLLSGLGLHDFKVAAMVICQDLNESRTGDRGREICALRTAYNIWKSRSSESHDARRVSAVLGVILGRLTNPTLKNPSPGVDTSIVGPVLIKDISRQPHIQPATCCEVPPDDIAQVNYPSDYPPDMVDFMPFYNTLNDPVDLDWNYIDQYLAIH
ncbi:hypothetical protein ACJ41O_013141 [Fusarium nematophilum]